jgi:hypothetical protein
MGMAANSRYHGLRRTKKAKSQSDCNSNFNRVGACKQAQALDEHRLAVVVPFKNRDKELKRYVPFMSRFLNKQRVAHEIWIVDQADDDKKFNRGWLINVGFALSNSSCDYLVMHDVDLLPNNVKLPYGWPGDKGSPLSFFNGNHPVKWYNYAAFCGAVFLMKRSDFATADGFSTQFWGWGGEDGNLYQRMRRKLGNFMFPERTEITAIDAWNHIDEDDGSKGSGVGRRKTDPHQPNQDKTITGVSKMCRFPPKGLPLKRPAGDCSPWSANVSQQTSSGVPYMMAHVNFACYPTEMDEALKRKARCLKVDAAAAAK